MKKFVLIILFFCFTNIAGAQEVLYCSEEVLGGFTWEDSKMQRFNERRYTIKVHNQSRISGEKIFLPNDDRTKCFIEHYNRGKTIYCFSSLGSGFSLHFPTYKFVYSAIFNSQESSDSLAIGRGRCEKF